MEHALRRVSHDPNVYDWFCSNGIYTSCHDLISRILQFDVDGDQLNVVSERAIIDAAERTVEKHDIVPLFYDANKASPEILTRETMFGGLKRAHEYSGIGQVSNSLTRLWSREDPDFEAAAMLTMYNNLVIDAAKTGKINSYENYPEKHKQINKAIGGKNGLMPFFFQYSKNGRKKELGDKKRRYANPNESVMNRICDRFSGSYRLNFGYDNLAQFNISMLLTKDHREHGIPESVDVFCDMDNMNIANVIESGLCVDMGEKISVAGYDILAEAIETEFERRGWALEEAYPSIVKFLFSEDNLLKASHKRMFWRVFGNIALSVLEANLAECSVCPTCGSKVPAWDDTHACTKSGESTFRCIDCGSVVIRKSPKQTRCCECQTAFRKAYVASRNKSRSRKGAA